MITLAVTSVNSLLCPGASRSRAVTDFPELSVRLSIARATDTPSCAFLIFAQDLRHHPLIIVIQQMTMKYRHTLDDVVGKVQDDVDGAAVRNVHGIQPCRIGRCRAILGKS